MKRLRGYEPTQVISIFDTPRSPTEHTCNIRPLGTFPQLYREHEQRFGIRLSYQEPLLALPGRIPGAQPLDAVLTTMHHGHAVWTGKAYDVLPVGLSGLVETADGYVPYGVRTMGPQRGAICSVPMGSANSALFPAFIEEARHELGVTDLFNVRLLGYHFVSGDFSGAVHYVLYGRTNLRFADLDELHTAAREAAAIKQATTIPEKQEAVRQAGLLNIDFWEHERLVKVRARPASIGEMVSRRRFMNGDGELLPVAANPLLMALQSGILEKRL